VITEVSPTANVVLDGSGNGRCFLSPPTGTKWALRLATLATSTATKHPKGLLYRGSSSGPLQLVDSTITGDAASSGKVAGPVFFSGSGVWAVWQGGDPGATATLQLFGTQGGRNDFLADSALGEGFPDQIALIAQSLQLGGDGSAGNPGMTLGVTPIPSELVTYYAGLTDPGTLVPGTLTQIHDGTSAGSYRYSGIFTDNGTPPSQQVWWVEGLRGTTGVVSETDRWAINFGGALGNPDIVFAPSIGFLVKNAILEQVTATAAQAHIVEIAGEAALRMVVNGDGSIHWADGTNPTDVTLKRNASNSLNVNGAFGATVVEAQNTGAGTTTLGVGDSGLGFFALVVDPQGVIRLGPGTATRDTILYRAAAAVLAADGIKANISGSAEVWNAVAFQNGFSNRGAGFPAFSYRKVPSPYGGVQLCGHIKSGATVASGTVIGTVGASYHPATEQTVRANNVTTMTNPVVVNVETNGNILLFGTWANGDVIEVGPDVYATDL
jgi:hypothetical protein